MVVLRDCLDVLVVQVVVEVAHHLGDVHQVDLDLALVGVGDRVGHAVQALFGAIRLVFFESERRFV